MFNENMTINETLQDHEVKENLEAVFAPILLNLLDDSYKNMPMKEAREGGRMPWGLPFPVDDYLESINFIKTLSDSKKMVWLPLCEADGIDRKEAYIATRKPTPEESGLKRPAVIICPGGGYECVASNSEGFVIARRMEEAGYKAFVIKYRVSPHRYPEPQTDLATAIIHVRENAKVYGIDPENVMIMGSSAGGHLCASFALNKDPKTRPDKVCLNYPVISFTSEQHEGSFQALTGGIESMRETLSVEQHVESDYPKTFVWACEDDAEVPVSNAKRMGEALKAAGCDYKLEIFPTGGHGCSLAYDTSARSWSGDMIAFMAD